jgi:aminoglycoside phosphotransferase (APT) family kinase protein
MDLKQAALDCLANIAERDDSLQPLYLQPDRAVYLAERSGVVLKAYADSDLLGREWRAMQVARSAGVPTPEPLAFTPGPPAVLATRFVAGEPLSSDHPLAARETGALLARFHGVGAQPPFTMGEMTWDGQILAWIERELASLRRMDVFSVGETGRLRDRFVRLRPTLAARPIALLHGDLQPDHILVNASGDRVVALLDFADAQPGDPLLDIAVLTLWDEALVEPLLAGYPGLADDNETRVLIAGYRLLRNVSGIPWLLERGYADHAARNVAAVRDCLTGGATPA